MSGPTARACAAMAATLGEHPDYRILTRLQPIERYGTLLPDVMPHRAAIVDVETTGLDTATAKIIQIGVLSFEFAGTGPIGRVLDTYEALNDPGEPLAPEIAKLTGLTDAMLQGQHYDPAHVAELLAAADLLIAHNAGYDRKIVERTWNAARGTAWGCSQRDVDWSELPGVGRGTILAWLLATTTRRFNDGHTALADCRSVLHCLATPQESFNGTPFRRFLDRVRQPTMRILAIGSPFERKDILRAHGYRWDAEGVSGEKVWFYDATPETMTAELAWLAEYGGARVRPRVVRVTAMDRYSVRAA